MGGYANRTSPDTSCCVPAKVYVAVSLTCTDDSGTHSAGGASQFSMTVTFNNTTIFSGQNRVTFPVAQDGSYTVAVTLPDGRSQTQTVSLKAAGNNPTVSFTFNAENRPDCNCFCPVPPSLNLISNAPDCNYQMFQSCTLTYGPPPPAMQQLNFTSNVYTSSESFVDPITNSSFFYYFWCHYNQFLLTRIFPTSPYGSPYRDAVLYTWTVGGYGNTCSPFSLIYGNPYPGSDADCSVQVTGSAPAQMAPPGARRAAIAWAKPRPGTRRVGIWCPCLLAGGGEQHQEQLIRTLDPARVSVVGAAVTLGNQPEHVDPRARASLEALVPVGFGLDAAQDLAGQCDVILSWAEVDADQLLADLDPKPSVVAISHLMGSDSYQ